MITVHTMAYNEEVLMQFMIDHYRTRFPGCHIVVYDNESTDRTSEIAKNNNCEVITYSTNNQVDDEKLRNLKNSCWKNAKTEWVLVCDVDEMIDINYQQLEYENSLGTTIILSEAYNMVNSEDNYDLANIKYGSRNKNYDKSFLFKRTEIKDINYVHGAHRCNPVGNVKRSEKSYITYHYVNVHPEVTYNKFVYTRARLSEINKKNKWGSHYDKAVTLDEVKGWFTSARQGTKKVIGATTMLKISDTGYWDAAEAHLHHGYSRPLVNWIADFLKNEKDKQIYDFGCGIGQYMQQLQLMGFSKLQGFEGSPPIKKVYNNILQQDLTKPFTLQEKGNCIFLEVAEHIPQEHEDIALNNIVNSCDGKLITSWAVRGQGGHGHVNCLDNHESIERFTRRGMVYLAEATESARAVIHATKNSIEECELPWFKNTTLIFEKAK